MTDHETRIDRLVDYAMVGILWVFLGFMAFGLAAMVYIAFASVGA